MEPPSGGKFLVSNEGLFPAFDSDLNFDKVMRSTLPRPTPPSNPPPPPPPGHMCSTCRCRCVVVRLYSVPPQRPLRLMSCMFADSKQLELVLRIGSAVGQQGLDRSSGQEGA